MEHSSRFLTGTSVNDDNRLNEFLASNANNRAQLFRHLAVGLARVLIDNQADQSVDIRPIAESLRKLFIKTPPTVDGQLQAGAELSSNLELVLRHIALSGNFPTVDTTWTINLCCKKLDDHWQRGENIFGSLSEGLWMLYGPNEKKAYYPACPFCQYPFPIPDDMKSISEIPDLLRRMYEFRSLADIAVLNSTLLES